MTELERLRLIEHAARYVLANPGYFEDTPCDACSHEWCGVMRTMARLIGRDADGDADEFNPVALRARVTKLTAERDKAKAELARIQAAYAGRRSPAEHRADWINANAEAIRHVRWLIGRALAAAPRCGADGCESPITMTQYGVAFCHEHAPAGALKILGLHDLRTVDGILSDVTLNPEPYRLAAEAEMESRKSLARLLDMPEETSFDNLLILVADLVLQRKA